MIGENAGADDFTRRTRVAWQGNGTKDVLQPGEGIARNRLNPVRGRFLRHTTAMVFLA
jgi:hypothetical protein